MSNTTRSVISLGILLLALFEIARASSGIANTASSTDMNTYLNWLAGPSEENRRYAEMYLMRLPDSVDALTRILNDDTQTAVVRASAAEALGFVGVEAKGSLKDLIRILHDRKNDPLIRVFAETAIEGIGGVEAKEAVPELAAALSDPNVLVRHFAALALLSIGDGAVAAVPEMTDALEHEKDEVVFYQIAGAIGKIGPQGKPALVIFRKRLRDGRRFERLGAAQGLGGLKDEAVGAISDLQRSLKQDPDPLV